MAQLVLTAAGYAIGSYFGYPQLGAIVGSAIGAQMSQPHLYGPRVTDLTVAPSAYGQGVPKTYGSDRVACAPIWQQAIQEAEHTDDGKGGPEVTTYSYSQSFAVLIGEGEILSIRRMWADALLVYDARTTATAEAQTESARFAQYWTLYQGTEVQDPDPTIEAVVGAGKVPALRGWAYIVFTDLPLERHGNRQPVISVEAVSEVEVSQVDPATGTELEPLRVYDWASVNYDEVTGTPSISNRPLHLIGPTEYTWVSQPTIPATNESFEEIAVQQAENFAEFNANSYASAGGWARWYAGNGYWYTSTNSIWSVVNWETPSYVRFPWGVEPNNGRFKGSANLDDSPEFVYYKMAHTTPQKIMAVAGLCVDVPEHIVVAGFPHVGTTYADHIMAWKDIGATDHYAPAPFSQTPIGQFGVAPTLATTWMAYMLTLGGKRVPTHAAYDCFGGNPCTSPLGKAQKQGDATRCVACDGTITPNRRWTIVVGTCKQLCAVEYRNGKLYQNALGPVLLPGDPNYSTGAYWDAAYAAAVADGTMQADVSYPVTAASYAQSTGSDAVADEVADADDTTVELSAIVTHICEAAGLTAGQIDVTELTDNVLGYTRPTRMAARAALEPLRRAFLFDAVESGAKIHFRKRGRSVTSTIAAADLGAGMEQPEPQRVSTTRGQESELPDVLSIVYKDLDLDYQPGNQEARRRAGESDQQASLEVPVVLRAATASQLAEVWLYDAWQSRTRRNISTTLAYAEIEPTDVIEVDDGDA